MNFSALKRDLLASWHILNVFNVTVSESIEKKLFSFLTSEHVTFFNKNFATGPKIVMLIPGVAPLLITSPPSQD